MGSDPTTFAAAASVKVDSALRQECEAIKGVKDLLHSVERRQKEHVAKTEMGLWMERSGRTGVTIWKSDLWMLGSGDEELTVDNFPSWRFALYRVSQLLTKMLGLESSTQLQIGGILDGSVWDAIALYDITRRAVRGDTLGRLLPPCHFVLRLLNERSDESNLFGRLTDRQFSR